MRKLIDVPDELMEGLQIKAIKAKKPVKNYIEELVIKDVKPKQMKTMNLIFILAIVCAVIYVATLKTESYPKQSERALVLSDENKDSLTLGGDVKQCITERGCNSIAIVAKDMDFSKITNGCDLFNCNILTSLPEGFTLNNSESVEDMGITKKITDAWIDMNYYRYDAIFKRLKP